jgi:outer membrane protein assembly factor BamA
MNAMFLIAHTDSRWRPACLLAVLSTVVFTAAAHAQQSRADAIEQQIADKAQQARPYEPGKLERALLFIEENNVLRRLSASADGWYPRLGGLTTGSGFAIGPGYRKYFQRDGVFNISAAASLKKYRAVEAELRSPTFADDRLAVELQVGHRHYPQERFFGLGPASLATNRVSYLFEDVTTMGGLLLWPKAPLRGGVRAGYMSPTVDSGSGRFPSIETVFSPAATPGLSEQPAYIVGEAYVELDYRDFPGNPRSGGHHRLGVSTYRDRDFDRYSFRRIDAQAMQLFPFLDKRRVIALRGLMALTDADEGNAVPFYLMPFVGGPETLRGFRERRFTDRNLLLFNAEYRYEIFAALDMALFFDAGMVAPRIEDLKVSRFETDYGIGFRFGTRENLILRFDIGLGGEATRYFLKFGPAF